MGSIYKTKGSLNWIIKRHKVFQTYYEIMIESYSSIMVLFGETSNGNFICVPDFEIGCNIVDFKNKDRNTKKLIELLGITVGTTVAEALYAFNMYAK